MGPEAWKRTIGESAWRALVRSDSTDLDELQVAQVLNTAVAVGFRPPELAPVVDPRGTKVLWPRGQDGSVPVLTAHGLQEHWEARGHGWVLLRVPQLCRAVAGGMLARLTELLAAYEEQCQIDGVDPVPAEAPPWVVGGPAVTSDGEGLRRRLALDSPMPRKAQRGVVQGPGAR